MTAMAQSERGFSKPLAIFSLSIAAITVALLFLPARFAASFANPSCSA